MKTKGFSLIEMVVVIVVFGTMAAIAIPKFIDFSNNAKHAADQGQLGALRSATYMLYVQNITSNRLVRYQNPVAQRPPRYVYHYWPTVASVWAQLQKTNAWQYYGRLVPNRRGRLVVTNQVTYTQTSGTWSVRGLTD